MRFLHLVWAGLIRRKARLTLTAVSVAAALLLFGLLASVNDAFKSVGQNAAAAHRLVTLARSGYAAGLPVGLYGKIQVVPGVRAASYVSGFFGTYQTAHGSKPRFFTGAVSMHRAPSAAMRSVRTSSGSASLRRGPYCPCRRYTVGQFRAFDPDTDLERGSGAVRVP